MKTNQKRILSELANNAKNDPNFMQRIQLFFKMIQSKEFKMQNSTILIAIGAIVYTVMPFDFDFIPVIGWVDDVTILMYALKQINKEIDRFINFSKIQNDIEIIGR